MVSPGSIAFTIFGLDIAWYGILIGFGFLLAGGIAYVRCPLHQINQDHYLNFILFLLPSIVIGARLYYVAFKWDYYKNHLNLIMDTRGGGLAIHGGIIAGIIVAIIICKHYKTSPFKLTDLCAVVLPLGQAIGRWGNFFNEEAHGGVTDSAICQIIDGTPYVPTFLYESVWCFILFIFLMYFDTKKRKFDGETTLLYFILYSLERFFVEGLRTDSLMLGNLRQAQVLSAVVIVLSIIFLIIGLKKAKKNEVKEEIVEHEEKEDK